MEVFVNLDLAQLAAIVDSDALPSLLAQPLTDHTVVADATAGGCSFTRDNQVIISLHLSDFLKAVADVVEGHLRIQSDGEPYGFPFSRNTKN